MAAQRPPDQPVTVAAAGAAAASESAVTPGPGRAAALGDVTGTAFKLIWCRAPANVVPPGGITVTADGAVGRAPGPRGPGGRRRGPAVRLP